MGKKNIFLRILVPSLLLTLIVMWACKDEVTSPDISRYEITGQLLDEENYPIANAILQVFSSESAIQGLISKDTTDENGYFTLNNLPENDDNLELRIEHDNFTPMSVKLKEIINDKNQKNLKIKMQHDTDCTAQVFIIVRDNNNNPINEAEVRLNKKDKTIRKTYTNDQGEVLFKNICPGEYWLRIYKTKYQVIEQSFSIEKGDSLNINFKLLENDDDTCCNGIIYFTVKDSMTKEPVSNVIVKLWKGKDKIKEEKTNDDGEIIFDGICKGNYQISFFKEGYIGQEFNFEMACNDTVEFNKYIIQKDDSCCNGVIYLIIKDSTTNQAIEYSKVNLWKDGKLFKDGKTNSEGLVKFTELCEGKYGFSIQKEGYQSFEFDIELKCDDTLEISKKMLKLQKDSCCDGKIVLFVKDSINGESVNGAKINLWRFGKLLSTKKTENGKVIFEELCEGEYGIDIEHEKYKNIEFEIKLDCNKVLELTKKLIPIEQKDSCCNGVIKVAPYDKETKKIIKGAKVKLWFGSDLIYQETVHEEPLIIKNLCEGKYQFTFIAEGYKSAEEVFELACNDTIDFPFYMEPLEKDSCCDGKLKISVRDSSSKEIIKGALIRLWKDGGKIAEKKIEGEYVIFEKLCEGKYFVDILHEEYKGIEFAIEIPCNETVEINKYLVKEQEPCCDGKLKIKPIDKNTKQIITGATVKLWKDGKLINKKVTENDYVIFEKLCKGAYGVDIEHENYKNIEFSIELGCNEAKMINKELEPIEDDSCCNSKIYTVVQDSSDNSNLKGVLAKLWKDGKPYKYGYTNENGLMVFENICEGEYALTFNKDGYKARETHIEVECNDTLELHYRILKESKDSCETAEALIKVIDKETEEPIANAVIKIYDKNNNLIGEGETNEDGIFLKTGLKAPSYYKFSVNKDGYNPKDESAEWEKCIKKTIIIELEANE